MSTAEVIQGPIFIGFTFNILLYGVMITQVYLYYTTYKEDKIWTKLFVALILLADTANTIFNVLYLYRALITHFGDVEYLATADWVFAAEPAITGITASFVQMFFAWRVAALTQSWPLVIAIFFGSLTGAAGSIATAFEVGRTPHFADFRDFKEVVILWLATETITDIIITTVLVYFLGFQHSDFMVDRIIRLTLQTGLITSIFAILDLVTYLAYPNGLHLLFNYPLCKLYSNFLMSSLNSRRGWRFGSSNLNSIHINSAAHLGLVAFPSSPLGSTNPPLCTRPLRSIGGSYDDDFKSHSGHSNLMIPPSALKIGRSDVLVHIESHVTRGSIGYRRQERPRSAKQKALDVALSIDTDTEAQAIRRIEDEEYIL